MAGMGIENWVEIVRAYIERTNMVIESLWNRERGSKLAREQSSEERFPGLQESPNHLQ